MVQPEIDERHYQALSEFRAALARYERASAALSQQRGLSSPQFMLLLHLAATPTVLTMNELAARLLATHNNAVGLVQRAEEAGLVRRMSDPEDGRRTRLALTGPGSALVQDLTARHLRELVEERERLLRSLRYWSAALAELPSPDGQP